MALAARLLCAAALLPSAALAASRVFGVAIMAEERAGDRVASVEISAGGGVQYHASLLAPPSDALCNVGFSREGLYFLPAYTQDRSGRQSILTLNASTGELVRNVTTTIAFQAPAMAYDDVSKLLYAVGFGAGQPAGFAFVFSVDPLTGASKDIGKVPLPDVQLCEASFSPPTAAMPLGALIFLWSPMNESAADAFVVFDVAKGAVVNDIIHQSGGLNSISVWSPPGGSGYELLAMSYLDTRPMQLLSIQPDSGASKVLLTLPVEGYVPFQGAQAFAEDTGACAREGPRPPPMPPPPSLISPTPKGLRRCRETCAADLQTRPPLRLYLARSLVTAPRRHDLGPARLQRPDELVVLPRAARDRRDQDAGHNDAALARREQGKGRHLEPLLDAGRVSGRR